MFTTAADSTAKGFLVIRRQNTGGCCRAYDLGRSHQLGRSNPAKDFSRSNQVTGEKNPIIIAVVQHEPSGNKTFRICVNDLHLIRHPIRVRVRSPKYQWEALPRSKHIHFKLTSCQNSFRRPNKINQRKSAIWKVYRRARLFSHGPKVCKQMPVKTTAWVLTKRKKAGTDTEAVKAWMGACLKKYLKKYLKYLKKWLNVFKDKFISHLQTIIYSAECK